MTPTYLITISILTKIIDARLHRHPYCPGPDSKLLVTSKSNADASAWWEEGINYYVKPPISDLFVEESRFDGKGFEMIEHIDKYFNPSGTVDSLSHIFDLIDIKQAQDESVITLKARLSRVFASLRMGGIAIDSALQVGFMLRALLSSYHGVVQDFRLGPHSLSTATLQTIIDQCVAYDKDQWKGHVNKTGKPIRTPSANAAGTSGDKANPYDAMASCLFGLHVSRWRSGCKDNSEKCMICHNTSNKPAHHTKDSCPILRQLCFKLVKRTPADGGDAASRVGASPAPAPAPVAPVPAPAVSVDGGLAGMHGAFTAATEADSYESGEEFDYVGKYEGSVYNGKSKSNVSIYPNASHATAEPLDTSTESMTNCCHTTSPINPQGVRTTPLPKHVIALLQNPPAHSTALIPGEAHDLLVADTGATDHMIQDKSVFISYWPVSGRPVHMGNNSFAPILGSGSAVIAINSKCILIRECLHVPTLCNPLYSLRTHQRQHGCGFISMQGLGMYVFFPSFIVEVDTATDCHLSYARSAAPPRCHPWTISSQSKPRILHLPLPPPRLRPQPSLKLTTTTSCPMPCLPMFPTGRRNPQPPLFLWSSCPSSHHLTREEPVPYPSKVRYTPATMGAQTPR